MPRLEREEPFRGNDPAFTEAPDLFRSLVEESAAVTFVDRADPATPGELVPVYVSPRVEEILGLTAAAWVGDPALRDALIHANDRERVVEARVACLGGGGPFAERYRATRTDGRTIWVDERWVVEREGDGRALARRGTIEDITPQQQAEQALRAGERRLRAIFDDAAMGIARVALDGWILEANAALADLVGCGRLELLGSYLGTLDEHEAPDGVPEEFVRLAAGGLDRFQMDLAYQRRDGDALWCHVAVSLIRDDEDKPEFAIAMFEDITARKAAEDELARRAMHDTLTGLPNRDLLLDRLGVALARTARGGGIALMFLDLDGFKAVNDDHGHDAGDVVLVQAARRFLAVLRASDTLARQGGDEFIVLCEDIATAGDAVATGERLVACLQEPIRVSASLEARIGVSIGVTVATDRSRNAERLIRDADTAMYRAKHEGRGRVALAAPDEG